MGSLPSGSVDVVTVAIPFTSVEVPSVVAPLVKVTVPAMDVAKVSVNVTEAPGNDGLTDDVSVDAGEILATVCVVVPTAEV